VGVVLNQVILICSLGLFVYIIFVEAQLSIVLIGLYSIAGMLLLSVFFGCFRMYKDYLKRLNLHMSVSLKKELMTIK
jgi:hypothetical protein